MLAIGKDTPLILIPAGAAEFVEPITDDAGNTTKSAEVAWRALPKTAPNAAAVAAPKLGVNAAVICALLFGVTKGFVSLSLIKIGLAVDGFNGFIRFGSPKAVKIASNGPYNWVFNWLIAAVPAATCVATSLPGGTKPLPIPWAVSGAWGTVVK